MSVSVCVWGGGGWGRGSLVYVIAGIGKVVVVVYVSKCRMTGRF